MKISGRTFLLSALVVPAAFLVAACGASGSGDSMSASVPDAAPAAPNDTGGEADGLDSSSRLAAGETAYKSTANAADAPEIAPTKAQVRAVISKGQISLHTEDVEKARFELQKLLDKWDGSIATEETDADEDGKTRLARLELRVPSPRFSAAMDGLAGLGTLVDRSRTSEDVTTQVIDNEARIRSQRLSLARVEQLMARARDLNQIIAIEAQLSRRQANLDSLEKQQTYLADQTSLSTITVYLSVPGEDEAVEEDDDGFWSGLESGWKALGSSTETTLTVIGAVLPFAVLLGLIAVPGWAVWRRRAARPVTAEI